MAWWTSGDSYDAFMGRWSRLVGQRLVEGLDLPEDASVLDVGCGTGVLTGVVLAEAGPSRVVGIDLSPDLLRTAADRLSSSPASFCVGSADSLPVADESVDAVVSGLVLNFVPDPGAAVAHMRRVTRSGGVVAAYVWDYAGGMQMLKAFWDTAAALDPRAAALNEGHRFPLCAAAPLETLFAQAGLSGVAVRPIDVVTTFTDFDDYWQPFLAGQAPAPAYAVSLSENDREELRQALRLHLPTQDDGSLRLTARAWAVEGRA